VTIDCLFGRYTSESGQTPFFALGPTTDIQLATNPIDRHVGVMTTTNTLAALIGLYFAAAGVGLFVERNNAKQLFRELVAQPIFGFLGGIIAFIIGGAIVGVHNNWNSLLSGFVSLVGWAALLEGVLMLACRDWFLGLFARLTLSSRTISALALGTVVLGAVLLSAAFSG